MYSTTSYGSLRVSVYYNSIIYWCKCFRTIRKSSEFYATRHLKNYDLLNCMMLDIIDEYTEFVVIRVDWATYEKLADEKIGQS